ncbi:lipopolysaccharide biosynthesis protein [Micromonospora sp. NPDC003816]|uniref:lipopolysaccharide biosynthesis protein n=1 Tax=Micromonospora sp. NPDC003816 TaxID=3364224 RepID=UPI0036947DAC
MNVLPPTTGTGPPACPPEVAEPSGGAGVARGGAVPGVVPSGRRPLLVRTAVALMSSTVASAALGFLFWVVAARWFPTEAVGRASGVVASMSLLAGLAQLNLTSLYARFLPGAGARTRRLVLVGYGASAAMSLALAVGFLALGLGSGLIGDRPVHRLVFVVAVLASAIFFIQDGVLAALRRPGLVPAKNIVASGAKLALLPLLAGVVAGDGVLLAWVLPMLVTMLVTNWWILARLTPRVGTVPLPGRARHGMTSFASAEYVTGLVNNAVAFLPPVLVAHALGATASAYFYVPWTIGVAGTTLLWNVVISFVVAASSDGAEARVHVRRALVLVGLVVGAGAVTLGGAAGALLAPLGGQYAAHGADALRLIGLSLPFTGVILLYAAFAIMEKRMWRMVLVQSTAALLFLGGGWYGLPRLGIVAPAVALLLAQAATALVLLPGLRRRLRAVVAPQHRPAWAVRPETVAAPLGGSP